MQQIKTELIPVIHVESNEQAFKNIELCQKVGINKVFLISHGDLNYNELINLARDVKSKYPKLWIGLNLLDLNANQAISLNIYFIDAIWTDASISIENNIAFRRFKGLYFGGLAFKYQAQPNDLKAACENACITTDVATTSGSATGIAPTKVKIEKLREYLGDHPMAIASGVTIDNVDMYLGLVNYLMVASSITDNNENLIEDKLIALKNKIDNHG